MTFVVGLDYVHSWIRDLLLRLCHSIRVTDWNYALESRP